LNAKLSQNVTERDPERVGNRSFSTCARACAGAAATVRESLAASAAAPRSAEQRSRYRVVEEERVREVAQQQHLPPRAAVCSQYARRM
jgi:hypothetical protein